MTAIERTANQAETGEDPFRRRAAKELRWRLRDPRVSIGRGTYGTPELILYSIDDRISIGRYCSIAKGTTILAGGEHQYRWTTTFPFRWYHGEDPGAELADLSKIRFLDGYTKGPTVIGSDVWIGHGASILSGVRIGDGAVIGALAVVASDVAPYSIIVGNPARCLKMRFEDDLIERLLALRWWDWKPDAIYQYQNLLCGPPDEFFRRIDCLSASEIEAYRDRGDDHDDVSPVERPAREHVVKRMARQVAPPIVYSMLSRLFRRLPNGIDPGESSTWREDSPSEHGARYEAEK